MPSSYLHDESPWNTDLLLPRVTEHSDLLEIQILLGGLSLVLSRLHPEFARSNFLATRRVAMRLTRAIEYGNQSKAHFIGADLQQSLQECGRALDPGTAMTLKNLLARTLKREAEAARFERQDDFTISDFLAEEQLRAEPGASLAGQRAVRV
ncbi:hypothetical protein [Pseudorhodoferax sp. Leaf267]|uniref:hypothetical protein n=1 Tax=Pseudorhodoferax sp. Leaf267 TaxID=1736316 RepID=UPI0006FB7816|nr:hypothetical protein [Pseudorhodoferax sp. Leaf267]KQP12520.1 hypothetical protein ASF43_19905 [Pseudorhodoferax sp. Leaf267]